MEPEVDTVHHHTSELYQELVYSVPNMLRLMLVSPQLHNLLQYHQAEVDKVHEPGGLDPELVITPAIFIDRIVVGGSYQPEYPSPSTRGESY